MYRFDTLDFINAAKFYKTSNFLVQLYKDFFVLTIMVFYTNEVLANKSRRC